MGIEFRSMDSLKRRDTLILSIIVPVFNVEQYIKRCLDSIIGQTFKCFEIILIDDGSTDSSLDICYDYAIRDNRIRVVHQENGGLSRARNAGIKLAQGEYIGFIDSDDWVDEHYYEVLINLAQKHDADIVSCLYVRNDGKKERRIIDEKKAVVYKYDRKEAINELILSALRGGASIVPVCTKIYKRRIMEKESFAEDLFYEDTLFNYMCLLRCDKFVLTTYNGYNYFKNQNSITGRTSEKIKDLYYITELMMKNRPDDESIKLNLERFKAKVDFSVLYRCIRYKNDDIEYINQAIDSVKHNFDVLFYSELSCLRKVALFFFKIIPKKVLLLFSYRNNHNHDE